MKTFLLSICAFLVSLTVYAQQQDFDDFDARFVNGYKSLNIAPLELSYVSGLKDIKSLDSVQKQEEFFKLVKADLSRYRSKELDASQRLDYGIIDYESNLNLERLALEDRWLKNRPADISNAGIITVPDGKAWYAYLLKRWIGDNVTPDEIFEFGIKEIQRVRNHIEDIRKKTGLSEDAFYSHLNDSSFFVSEPQAVQDSFEHVKAIVYANLHNIFNEKQIPYLKIERGTDKVLAQTPGFYNDNVFYYNLFDKPYNQRQFQWLFIHEGVPGHHYQLSIMKTVKSSPVQDLFFYPGFVEGWGAYVEELGGKLGVYRSPYDELGKWEWDIVRSVRVPLDVGLNYYGWTDEQALEFWKKNIRNQDDIAMREIKRMRRWPAQVVTYKYGALQIMDWKDALQKKQGKDFDIKGFHERILENGSMPLFMLKEIVLNGS